MDDKTRKNPHIENGDFVVDVHQQTEEAMTIRGNLTLKDYACMYSDITVEHGTIYFGSYAFINKLSLPYGGEIFFSGKLPFIRHLEAPSLTVHIPKNCEHRWTDFVQINNAHSVIVRRDIDY